MLHHLSAVGNIRAYSVGRGVAPWCATSTHNLRAQAGNGVQAPDIADETEFEVDTAAPYCVFGVCGLSQGIRVGNLDMGWIGAPRNPPPVQGCFPVFVSSDSQGKFGHECPACDGYRRSDGAVWCCPYRGTRAQRYELLTQTQLRYVHEY